MTNTKKNVVVRGLFWKMLERFGVTGTQFVLQIILARFLDPNHYGTLSMMIVFTTLANVFIQRGFNTALIQNKDVTDEDYSSVFWVSIFIAAIMYMAIFLGAPLIATIYKMPDIVVPLRVIALVLFPGALNSVQLAKVSREMNFKKVFTSNLCAILIAGVAGIVVALNGGGLWALVVQNITNTFVACMVMRVTSGFKLRFVCNMKRVKSLFSYGWKILSSSLLDTLYQDLNSLVVGLKYSSATLGFYNRGKHFPQFLGNIVNSSVQSVMLPAMSSNQDNKEEFKKLMRNSITMSAYLVFPMMAGLAAVASPLVILLLTEKWIACVPYMQIYCFNFAFHPIHSCNIQAINAMGRSDIYLKLEIIKKTYGLIALFIAIVFFDSPLAIAMTGMITTWLSWFVNATPNKKLVSYSYIEQIVDILPSFFISIIMFFMVYMIGKVQLNIVLLLVIQIIAGVIIYIILSILIKPVGYRIVMSNVKHYLQKKGK